MKKRKPTAETVLREKEILSMLERVPCFCAKQINARLSKDCKELNIHNIHAHLKRMEEDGLLKSVKRVGKYRVWWLSSKETPPMHAMFSINNRHFADEAYTHKRAYMCYYEE